MAKQLKVLSLFDGISCAQIALNNLGLNFEYHASEVDKFAIEITQNNYPNTKQLGDVRNVNGGDYDLIIAGSPCQGFSFAGKQLNFNDHRSKLFFEFIRILKENKPCYFLLENVVMKKEYQDIISDLVGIEPIKINSSLLSAQNRNRLYWTNIANVEYPEDLNIKLSDIIENGIVDRDKSYCIDANYWKGGNLKSYFEKKRRQLVFISCARSTGRYIVNGKRQDAKMKTSGLTKQYLEIRKDNKTNTLTTVQKDNIIYMHDGNLNEYRVPFDKIDKETIRKLTPLECERLQTIPDNYTAYVSNTQRYKCIGNSFTVKVIEHILIKLLDVIE